MSAINNINTLLGTDGSFRFGSDERSLQSLRDISDGRFNKGEIVAKQGKDGSFTFGKVNNYVWSVSKNKVVPPAEQNRIANAAVFRTLLSHYGAMGGGVDADDRYAIASSLLSANLADAEGLKALLEKFDNPYIAVAFNFLVVGDTNDKPLSRDEVRLLFKLLDEGKGASVKPSEQEVASQEGRLMNLRAFKIGFGDYLGSSARRDVLADIKGWNVKNKYNDVVLSVTGNQNGKGEQTSVLRDVMGSAKDFVAKSLDGLRNASSKGSDALSAWTGQFWKSLKLRLGQGSSLRTVDVKDLNCGTALGVVCPRIEAIQDGTLAPEDKEWFKEVRDSMADVLQKVNAATSERDVERALLRQIHKEPKDFIAHVWDEMKGVLNASPADQFALVTKWSDTLRLCMGKEASTVQFVKGGNNYLRISGLFDLVRSTADSVLNDSNLGDDDKEWLREVKRYVEMINANIAREDEAAPQEVRDIAKSLRNACVDEIVKDGRLAKTLEKHPDLEGVLREGSPLVKTLLEDSSDPDKSLVLLLEKEAAAGDDDIARFMIANSKSKYPIPYGIITVKDAATKRKMFNCVSQKISGRLRRHFKDSQEKNNWASVADWLVRDGSRGSVTLDYSNPSDLYTPKWNLATPKENSKVEQRRVETYLTRMEESRPPQRNANHSPFFKAVLSLANQEACDDFAGSDFCGLVGLPGRLGSSVTKDKSGKSGTCATCHFTEMGGGAIKFECRIDLRITSLLPNDQDLAQGLCPLQYKEAPGTMSTRISFIIQPDENGCPVIQSDSGSIEDVAFEFVFPTVE